MIKLFRSTEIFSGWVMWKILAIVVSFSWLCLSPVQALEDCEKNSCDKNNSNYSNCLEEKQICYQNNINETRSSAVTLKNTILVLNGEINLQQIRIDQTLGEIFSLEKEIVSLDAAISNLSLSLDNLTKLLIARVTQQYKQSRKTAGLIQMLLTKSFSQVLTRLRYLADAQQQSARGMQLTESQRLLFDEQKQLREKKQREVIKKKTQLEKQKVDLTSKRAVQQNLLKQTQNDEKKFQNLLAQATAELNAINDIIAGKGSEIEVGYISESQRIASIIQGESCNSNGTHLHFIVSENGIAHNPFNYLSSINYENSSGGDSFNPSGSWSWPISSRIQYNQGFGHTWAIKNTWVGRIYSFHNGIDINSSSSEIRAVKSGTLYRGSYRGQNGCNLRYVRVAHSDSGLDTFYLHVNY